MEGQDIFARKCMYEKLKNASILHDICRENNKVSEFYIFALAKMAEFYVMYAARKCPEFFMTFARKIFSRNLGGGVRASSALPHLLVCL